MPALALEYPQLFDKKLKSNPGIRAAVDSSLTLVADVLQVSKLPFFPDYTDHGVPHLNGVLEITDKLIPAKAREIFTAEDAAVLIFSVLLHDLALHLSEAGFMSLLRAQNHHGSSQWTEIWGEFLSTAKHWDDHRLVEVFGADETGNPRALVRDPFDHYGNLTESDRKLIGEFIREHHAQMAYEFAVFGFPGAAQRIQFGSLDRDLKELAGIVAGSHGFPLRDCLQCLEEKEFNKVEYNNVHPIFLMGILRVADFLDLGIDRAPLIGFAYKEIKSSVSREQWRTNQKFRRISWGNPDPESIHIPAKPTDVESYLELKRWLGAIQSELDMAWAVFGEVYGALPRFSDIGLAIRRVRSNIADDPEKFARNASFVPRRVELGVAGPDLVKLFIEPLYGNHPEIGIRELIQNAVDAVWERWEFERTHPDLVRPSPQGKEGDVVVWLDDPDENGVARLTVTDNGIGMTDEVIADYFLKVGASFRRSIAWKREFESAASISDKPRFKSRVLRSGRFGIGVLAAFLLGDEIEVSTRHVTSQRGVRFSLRLSLGPAAVEAAPLQLNYAANLPVGTTITVKVSKAKRAKVEKGRRYTFVFGADIFANPFLWDWYCLGAPSVVRLQGRERKRLEQSSSVPPEESALPRGWHSLRSSDYRTVHALVHGAPDTHAPDLVCNGIRVHETRDPLSFWPNPLTVNWKADFFPPQGAFRLRVPDFSVFDPDGNLPLNLQRTGLTNTRLDFATEAFATQAKSALAKFVRFAPEQPEVTHEFLHALYNIFDFDQAIPAFFTNSGTALLTPTNLRLARVKGCLLVNLQLFEQGWQTHFQARYDAVAFARQGNHGSSSIYSLNELNRWIASARVITRSDENPTVAKPLRFRCREFSCDGLHVHRTANCAASLLDQDDLQYLKGRLSVAQNSRELGTADDFVAAELFLKDQPLSESAPPELSLGNYWEGIIRQPVIPFDPTERMTKLEHAYTALREYLTDFSDPTKEA